MPCTCLFLPIDYEGDLEGLTQLRTCLKLDGVNIILTDSYQASLSDPRLIPVLTAGSFQQLHPQTLKVSCLHSSA